MVWFSTVLGLHLAVDVALPVAIHLANGYAFGFVLMACFAIRRYLSALLATYVIFLFTSLGAIFLIYIHRLPFTPIVSIVVLTCAGLYGPILLVQPLARQHADAVENALLDKQVRDPPAARQGTSPHADCPPRPTMSRRKICGMAR